MAAGRIRAGAALIRGLNLHLGNAARQFCPHDHQWFAAICAVLGTSSDDTALRWNTLAKVTALTGVAPSQVTDREFLQARTDLLNAYCRRGMQASGRNLAAVFSRLQATLFHGGRVSSLRRPAGHAPVSVTGWSAVPPEFAATARRYVGQVTLSLRPGTVKHIEHDLRQFGTWLAGNHPDVTSCADLQRHHIEAFKAWLSTHPTRATGKPLNRVSVKNALINLHCFFDRITEWGYPDAPVRPLVFTGDLPTIDKPLPRFLDDAAAARLLRAARADPDPLARLIVEMLARTGICRSELLGLTAGAVVQIGSAYWLRIQVGKLHNDRYIPLHPQLKELLDHWVTHHRPSAVRCDALLIEHNRPISNYRVSSALHKLAAGAELGHRRQPKRGVERGCGWVEASVGARGRHYVAATLAPELLLAAVRSTCRGGVSIAPPDLFGEVYMRRALIAVLIAGFTLMAGAAPAFAAGNPSGTGLPSQSCQDIVANGGTEPGNSSSSPGSPFNEPTSTSAGGTGGQHYNETSQYDVACYQVSQH